jgi:Fe-S-cluster-containing dehydrogenase component
MQMVGATARRARSAVRVTEQSLSCIGTSNCSRHCPWLRSSGRTTNCEQCQAGVIPKDYNLDIVDTSFSLGVRRMMGQVGGKDPFDEAAEC